MRKRREPQFPYVQDSDLRMRVEDMRQFTRISLLTVEVGDGNEERERDGTWKAS